MKKIFSYWLVFFLIFGGIVWGGYTFSIASEVIITTLMVIYFCSQTYVLIRGYRTQKNIWIISGIIVQGLFAVLSPLYYSNFGDPVHEFITGTWLDTSDAFTPCQLCWWARIMMFPLLPLACIYAIEKHRPLLWYIYIVTIFGMCLEAFHYILQKPAIIGKVMIENPFGCTAANPCEAISVQYFGFITIPLLCFIAFLVIHILVSFLLFSKKLQK